MASITTLGGAGRYRCAGLGPAGATGSSEIAIPTGPCLGAPTKSGVRTVVTGKSQDEWDRPTSHQPSLWP
jgi:hypothetical protein